MVEELEITSDNKLEGSGSDEQGCYVINGEIKGEIFNEDDGPELKWVKSYNSS